MYPQWKWGQILFCARTFSNHSMKSKCAGHEADNYVKTAARVIGKTTETSSWISRGSGWVKGMSEDPHLPAGMKWGAFSLTLSHWSASDWCSLPEASYKCMYTIQYNCILTTHIRRLRRRLSINVSDSYRIIRRRRSPPIVAHSSIIPLRQCYAAAASQFLESVPWIRCRAE